ncbi:PilZ domain-containing protein [Thermodesulfobacteriota bacterium]
MENKDSTIERRRSKRYKAVSGVFAVNAKFGQIIDISRGGLSFKYVEKKGWPKELFERGVLFGDDDFCLDEIHIKTVTDYIVANGLSSARTIFRRCGVQFGELSHSQQVDLDFYIWANTEAEIDTGSLSKKP